MSKGSKAQIFEPDDTSANHLGRILRRDLNEMTQMKIQR